MFTLFLFFPFLGWVGENNRGGGAGVFCILVRYGALMATVGVGVGVGRGVEGAVVLRVDSIPTHFTILPYSPYSYSYSYS